MTTATAPPNPAGVFDYNTVTGGWDEAHKYTPTSRHRRRLLLKVLDGLDFGDVLDAGCAQPYLLREIVQRYYVSGYGCDVSQDVMDAGRLAAPDCQFKALDLSRQAWPGGKQFDLVLCSEVLEHIPDWESALDSLVNMARRHLVITVPGGKLRPVEKMLGHLRHYEGPELLAALERRGCRVVRFRRWGFPAYDFYKRSISALSPRRLHNAFCSGQKPYNAAQKVVAHALTAVFYVNDLFPAGDQLIVVARPPARGAAAKRKAA